MGNLQAQGARFSEGQHRNLSELAASTSLLRHSSLAPREQAANSGTIQASHANQGQQKNV